MFEMFKRKPNVRKSTIVTEDGEVIERDYLTDEGELPDPTPMSPPIGYKKQPSMVQIMRDMIQSEHLRRAAEAAGHESFEEADDFDVPDPDGEMPGTVHENEFDPPIAELLKDGAAAKRDREEGEKAEKRRLELEAEEAEERAYRKRRREEAKK